MAKEKRDGNLLERPRTRLPNELAICRRRDAVRNLHRTDAEYDVRIQESNRESGTQDPPDKTKILSNQSNMNSNTKRFFKVGEMSIEILKKNESVKYLGQRISFHQQETLEIKSRIRAAWATFHKYRQELTLQKYLLNHRLRLFDDTVSPTICYAAGTWTPSKEQERMIQSMQRKMLRLIIQTKRKYKKIEKQDIEPKDEKGIVENTENFSIDEESGDGQSTKSEDDVDSGVTFDEDSEKEIDTIEIEEEDWIDYIKRSTADALDKMERAKIRCWNRTHKRKRWEDDINDFLKQILEEKEEDEPIERKT